MSKALCELRVIDVFTDHLNIKSDRMRYKERERERERERKRSIAAEKYNESESKKN